MVKKSSILNKIVGRFRGGSVRVESSRTGGAAGRSTGPAAKPSGKPAGKTAAPNGGARQSSVPVNPIPEEIIPDSKRKLSPQENASLTMSNSFRELSTLLRGVQTRMEDQGGKLGAIDGNVSAMGEHIAKLPAAAQAQVDMLRNLVESMERQNAMNGRMVETFGELPSVMKGVQESLARTAATDERTAKTLDDFKQTMDRIQGNMGDMVKSTAAQAEATTSLAQDQKGTVQSLETATQDGLEALRRAQEDQANRMTKIVGETGRWNRIIVVLLVLGVGAMVAILAALVNGQ